MRPSPGWRTMLVQGSARNSARLWFEGQASHMTYIYIYIYVPNLYSGALFDALLSALRGFQTRAHFSLACAWVWGHFLSITRHSGPPIGVPCAPFRGAAVALEPNIFVGKLFESCNSPICLSVSRSDPSVRPVRPIGPIRPILTISPILSIRRDLPPPGPIYLL